MTTTKTVTIVRRYEGRRLVSEITTTVVEKTADERTPSKFPFGFTQLPKSTDMAATPTVKKISKSVQALLDRCDDPAAALAALESKFKGDVLHWQAWLRWLDETGYRA